MSTPSDPVTVYDGPLVESQQVYAALEGHGIRAELLDQNVGGGYPFFGVRVVVRPADVERALEVLEASGLVKPRPT
jgi:hypothetical protein